jgi:cephalosporin-C deacetylase-like acetyl esterase
VFYQNITEADFYNCFYKNDETFSKLKSEADVFFRKTNEEKDKLTTVKKFEERRRLKRKQFIASLGGLPKKKTPLNPKITKEYKRDDYTLKNVVFESRPKFYVTSLLYVPHKLMRKNPAVLFMCGHSQNGKAYENYQRVCIEMARAGFVVMAMDPIGQGERLQYMNKKTGHSEAHATVHEHVIYGNQCDAIGTSVAQYFVWDGIRAIDYLCTLPFVDKKKIGVTGNSGGGTQTSYMLMADDRIAAGAPCTYINSREVYLKSGQAHDSEQNLFGSIRDGIDHDDYLTAIAPRPVIVGAARFDFFPLIGTEESVRKARKVFKLYGKENNIKLAIGDHWHEYSDIIREAVINWFTKHLLGSKKKFKTRNNEEITLEPEEVTNCVKSGNIGSLKGFKNVFQYNLDNIKADKKQRKKKLTRNDIIKLLGIDDIIAERKNKTYPITTWDSVMADNYSIIRERVELHSHKDLHAAGLYFRKEELNDKKTPTVILIPENGLSAKESIYTLINKYVQAGKAVFVAEPRDTGFSQKENFNYFTALDLGGQEFRHSLDYWMLGKSYVGRRVFDILRTFDYLTERKDVDTNKITIHGTDYGALLGFYAAAVEPRINGGIFDRMLTSYEDFANTKFYSLVSPARMFPHGILKTTDIPAIKKLLPGSRFKFPNPHKP